jgi:hypothetical protein
MAETTADDPLLAHAVASSRRERVRHDAVESIPGWYHPWAHLAVTSVLGLGVLAFAITRLHRVRPVELLAIVGSFVISNAIEWRAHRGLLHRRVWPLHVLYDRHTPQHHSVYGYDDMAIRSWREARLVLIPAVGIASIVGISAPFACAAGWVFGANVGWIQLACGSTYVVLYEWLHLSYHLPLDHPIGRLHLVAVLREHHRRHHHPRLMQRWNFNVTVPLWDFLHGSLVTRAQLDQVLAKESASAHR